MNCLEYALGFWDKNPNYLLHYNSDHVINLPVGATATGFLEIKDYGFGYFERWYAQGLITETALKLLHRYFDISNP